MKPSPPANSRTRLSATVDRQAQRLRRAERERRGVLAQTAYLGTLGLVFVLPLVAGAYLGRWLDQHSAGYSIRWTLSLLFLGLVVGAWNAWQLIKRHED
ncbi:AtpZ/AtpI family protein [Methylococcus sp. ANG]|uniref:AtpZ/AtpI family protein n=1 Tax=unclassified Methylococcus TaxID=2618889 RepID=UPI001C52B542|nr:AtpZ/AtpI family protein [Methylococcus sp. Mc7]QXP85758.1 AtpZ/AtpI family protein [Methylococcus sp. Mc7]